MFFRCKQSNCLEEAFWECTCKDKLRFCDKHIKQHSIEKMCYTRYEKKASLRKKVKACENALNQLIFNMVSLAGKMIQDIDNCLQESLNYIKSQKILYKNLILNSQENKAKNIIEWGNSLIEQSKDKSKFSLNAHNFFDIHKKLYIVASKLESNIKKTQSVCEKIDQNSQEKKVNTDEVEKFILKTEPNFEQNEKSIIKLNEAEKKNEFFFKISQEKNCIEKTKNAINLSKFKGNKDEDSIFRLNKEQKVKYLIQLGFKDFKKEIYDRGYQIEAIEVSSNADFLYICNFKADCKLDLGMFK